MTTTILLPSLNERLGLQRILPLLKSQHYDQILVVDGGSTDGSVEYAIKAGVDVVQQAGRGVRRAYLESFPHVRGELVVTFSPDGNSLLEAIDPIIAKLTAGADMVIASRYLGTAKSLDDTLLTALGNRVFTRAISLFGYRYTDAMVMFRGYRRDLIARLGLAKIRSDWWERNLGRHVSWEPLMSIRAAKLRAKIAEIPADEPVRFEDESGRGRILPSTRIHHIRAGAACMIQLLEEVVKRRFASGVDPAPAARAVHFAEADHPCVQTRIS